MNLSQTARDFWQLWEFDPRLKTWLIVVPALVLTCYILVYVFFLLSPSEMEESSRKQGRSAGVRAFLPSMLLSLLAFVLLRFYLPPHLLSKLSSASSGAGLTKTAHPVKVWVNTKSGVYYCSGARAYGRLKPGNYMDERDAVEKGYRPFSHRACPSTLPITPKSGKPDSAASERPATSKIAAERQ
jgi:hypothetical protein